MPPRKKAKEEILEETEEKEEFSSGKKGTEEKTKWYIG